MADSKTAILWFRQDLRLEDNPALMHALNQGYQIIPVYILDEDNAGQWAPGRAQKWWLYKSLWALNARLGDKMLFLTGDAKTVIPELAKQTGAQAVFWNRCYEPWRIARDRKIQKDLKEQDFTARTFNASLLWEPWEISKSDGTPYKVFTPFYRKGCLEYSEAEPPIHSPAPDLLQRIVKTKGKNKKGLETLDLLPKIKWYKKLETHWEPGENGAQKRLQAFLEQGLKGYKPLRNRPDLDHTSKLSPHLHHGEISPRALWHAVQEAGREQHCENDMDVFCSELGWREFSYHLLYHFPEIPWENMQEKFNAFPWKTGENEDLEKWRRGQTGIPIIDAGMRELWETGWMHNRVRMIAASFLVKNLLHHWHRGAEWFWDTLVDADLANNSVNWQWVAGSGADAAPYFRIFNPETQAKKFDPDQAYIRKWVPEYGTDDYPQPVVSLKESRSRALEAFESVKKSR